MAREGHAPGRHRHADGACVRALGTSISAFRQRRVRDAVAEVAATQGEPCCAAMSRIHGMAQERRGRLNNISEGVGRGDDGGALLRDFLPAGVHWAHLDIAGTFWLRKAGSIIARRHGRDGALDGRPGRAPGRRKVSHSCQDGTPLVMIQDRKSMARTQPHFSCLDRIQNCSLSVLPRTFQRKFKEVTAGEGAQRATVALKFLLAITPPTCI